MNCSSASAFLPCFPSPFVLSDLRDLSANKDRDHITACTCALMDSLRSFRFTKLSSYIGIIIIFVIIKVACVQRQTDTPENLGFFFKSLQYHLN